MYWTNLVNNLEKQAAAQQAPQFDENDMIAMGALAGQVFGGHEKQAGARMDAFKGAISGMAGKVKGLAGQIPPRYQQMAQHAGMGALGGAALGGLGGALREDGSFLGGAGMGALGGAALGGALAPGLAAGQGLMQGVPVNNPMMMRYLAGAGIPALAGLGALGYGIAGA